MTAENAATDGVESITPTELHARLEAGEGFLLDVRAEADFEEWRIGGDGVETANYPYFELLEGLPADLEAALPDDRPITVVCAKGKSSALVAEQLRDAGYHADHLADGMNGWARVHESHELAAGGAATIVQYRRPSSGCLAYLVVSDGEAAVIDPLRAFADEYVRDLRDRGAELVYAIDTHVHADHVSGIRNLADRTGATPVVPGPAADRGIDYDRPFETVADGETLTVGRVDIEALHTPGHTTGMTAYRVGDVLFTGDGLFTDGVARPDLEDPEAARDAARTLYESLTERVLGLPDETVIAPAHGSDSATNDGADAARLGELRRELRALSMTEDEFVGTVAADMPPRPANYETIIATNLGRESTDDETAFELELGPNNCAASEDAAELR